ncbi:hypothetical protein F383_27054 [Gossypium arboreum]|uniref:Uncharacterized protein n=1 Tax=Gossypium arboreum TaxID=29729 RepID=A0A0B0P5K9_GOSAR|nr:hypothetical protein F383_27054 [Gossypium arboreum]
MSSGIASKVYHTIDCLRYLYM